MPVSLTIFLCLSFAHHKGSRYFVLAAVHKNYGAWKTRIDLLKGALVHAHIDNNNLYKDHRDFLMLCVQYGEQLRHVQVTNWDSGHYD